jgi:hypothetical protein
LGLGQVFRERAGSLGSSPLTPKYSESRRPTGGTSVTADPNSTGENDGEALKALGLESGVGI